MTYYRFGGESLGLFIGSAHRTFQFLKFLVKFLKWPQAFYNQTTYHYEINKAQYVNLFIYYQMLT